MPNHSLCTYALIPTRDRPDVLKECVSAIRPQVDRVVIINNTRNYELGILFSDDSDITVIYHDEDPPNLSRLWNVGLHEIDRLFRMYVGENEEFSPYSGTYYVAVLNDDAIVGSCWFRDIREGLEESGAAIGCVVERKFLGETVVHRTPEPVSLHHRLTGWAFVIRGNAGLQADERFGWWYGDDDLDWTARTRGGTMILSSPEKILNVRHLHANAQTVGALASRTVIDRQEFIKKWGQAPW